MEHFIQMNREIKVKTIKEIMDERWNKYLFMDMTNKVNYNLDGSFSCQEDKCSMIYLESDKMKKIDNNIY